MILLYIVQKMVTLTNVACLWEISYRTQFQDPVLTDAGIAPTSQIRASAVLLLQIVGYLSMTLRWPSIT